MNSEELITLWAENSDKDLLGIATGNFAESLEDLVLIKGNEEKGYVIAYGNLANDSYQENWQSGNFSARFYRVLADDLNGDGIDELIIADSSGIKICKWNGSQLVIEENSLQLQPDTYLGTTKLNDKGLALVVIQGSEVTSYRVSKTGLEELAKQTFIEPAKLALTADLDNDGGNELITYKETAKGPYIISYKLLDGSFEVLLEHQLATEIKAWAFGTLRGGASGLVLLDPKGNISFNRLQEDTLHHIGEKAYPDSEIDRLTAEVSGPGLITLKLVPSTLALKNVSLLKSDWDKVLLLTNKGKVLLGRVPLAENALSNPVTFLEATEETFEATLKEKLKIDGELVDLTSEVVGLKEKVEAGKIYVLGKVYSKYLYRPTGKKELVTGEEQFDFNTTITDEKVSANDWVQVLAQPCETVLNSGGKEVEIENKIILDLKYLNQKQVNFLTAVAGKRQENFVETTIQVETPVRRRRTQTVVRGTVTIPPTQDPIEQVLEANARVRNLTVQALNNRAIVQGVLEVDIMFVADTMQGDQPVRFIESEIPFSVVIDVPGLRPGMSVRVTPHVEFVSARLVNNRTIEINAVVAFDVRVTAFTPIEVITEVNGFQNDDMVIDVGVDMDADIVMGVTEVSPETGLEVEFAVGAVPVNNVIARRQTQVLVEDVVEIPPQKPDVELVLSTNGVVRTTDIRVIPDKVVIRGILNVTIRYVADTPAGDQPVHAVRGEIPFTTFIDLPGITARTPVNVQMELEYIKGRRRNGRSIDVTAIVKVFAQASRQVRALARL